jgi:oligopeptide transport system ATP-binding protein
VTDDILIEARGLTKLFPVRRGVFRRKVGDVHAVDDINLVIRRGEALGLVGESGSGKSTFGRLLIRLVEATAGSALLDGHDVTQLDRKQLKRIRARMQMVFQDPYSSLNPRVPVGAAVREPLDIGRIGDPAGRRERVGELFDLVNLDRRYLDRLPHELSGGQRQRVGIARALASSPDFVVADEAIASLDVSIQAQIVNLLKELQSKLGLTYLFITHDLGMARYMCDRIAVLYLGRVVEIGSARELTERPRHPYTMALLSAVPVADPVKESTRQRIILTGDVPSAHNPPPGCRFNTRCAFATDVCRVEAPPLRDFDGRELACHNAETVLAQSSPHAPTGQH